MNPRHLTLAALAAALTAALVTAPSFAADDGPSAAELFEAKCSVCHPTSRPLGKTKDRAGWERTVKRMQGKKPGHLSDAEVESIVNYLTEIRGL